MTDKPVTVFIYALGTSVVVKRIGESGRTRVGFRRVAEDHGLIGPDDVVEVVPVGKVDP
jgi:hypothetical protein